MKTAVKPPAEAGGTDN